MKRVLLVSTVSALLVLLFASAALAQKYNYGGGMNASPTATAGATASPTASATATATASASASPTATAAPLPATGGPALVGPVSWVATLTLIASGVGARALLLRRGFRSELASRTGGFLLGLAHLSW